jgi:hypothetical protein
MEPTESDHTFDREAAWKRVQAQRCLHFDDDCGATKAAFLAELDAAVAWAGRRERELAAKLLRDEAAMMAGNPCGIKLCQLADRLAAGLPGGTDAGGVK